jgi:hypothetical protein
MRDQDAMENIFNFRAAAGTYPLGMKPTDE